jgi:hypothetical protein
VPITISTRTTTSTATRVVGFDLLGWRGLFIEKVRTAGKCGPRKGRVEQPAFYAHRAAPTARAPSGPAAINAPAARSNT